MPSTNQINRELVKAFNSVLLFHETFITNLTVEEDHIVLSFDKNMNIDQCREYLINMRESIVEKFCGSESAAKDFFYTVTKSFFLLTLIKGNGQQIVANIGFQCQLKKN